jgi:hypothetical protein
MTDWRSQVDLHHQPPPAQSGVWNGLRLESTSKGEVRRLRCELQGSNFPLLTSTGIRGRTRTG